MRPAGTEGGGRRRRFGAVLEALAVAPVVACLLAGACGPKADREASPEEAARAPQRIIAVAPSAVEILFALGAGDRVVGVGDYVRHPPEAAELPRIGGLYDARFETVAALEPDLAVLLPSEEELATSLRRLGIEVLIVDSESIADVVGAIETVGERLGLGAEGRSLAAELGRRLEPVPRPDASTRAPRTLLAVAREPGSLAAVLVAGPGTFLDELLTRAGGVNVFADAGQRYPQVGAESIVERRPEVIVELQPESLDAEAEAALAAEWAELGALPAVDAGCVTVLAGDYTVLPGPRMPRLYDELRRALEACSPAEVAGEAGGPTG